MEDNQSQVNKLDGSAIASPAPEASAPEKTGERSRAEVLRYTVKALRQLGRHFHADDLKNAFPEAFGAAPESAQRSAEASGAVPQAFPDLHSSYLEGMALGDHMVSKYFPKSPAPSPSDARSKHFRSKTGTIIAAGWTGNALIDERHARDLALDGWLPVSEKLVRQLEDARSRREHFLNRGDSRAVTDLTADIISIEFWMDQEARDAAPSSTEARK